MSQEPKIVSCRITPQPKDLFDPMPEVWVKLEGDSEEIKLLTYYPDEISFTPQEFIGLTISESRHLHFKKDNEFLKR